MESFSGGQRFKEMDQSSRKIPISRKIDIKLEKDLEDLTLDMIKTMNTSVQDIENSNDIKNTNKDEASLGVCGGCNQNIESEAVLAGKAHFHKDCFTCHHCKTRLTGKFFMVDANYFCDTHKTVGLDKCSSCGDFITDGALVTGNNKYHPACFNCHTCHMPLDGKFFTTKDGKNICELDYKNSQPKCSHCSLPMLDKILSGMDRDYHPACFRCALCDAGLDGIPFIMDGKAINCKDCYSRYKAKQCFNCGEGIVSSSERKTTLITCEGRNYHEQCYNCKTCEISLAGEYCFTSGDLIYCTNCKK